MLIDSLGQLSNAQALTATALSTNVVDFGNVTPKRQIGVGKQLWVVFCVTVAADFTTGDETYQFELYTSAAANMGSPTVLATRAILAATLIAGFQFSMAVPRDGMKEFFSAHYTLAGTTPTVTVTAFVTDQEPVDHTTYAAGDSKAV